MTLNVNEGIVSADVSFFDAALYDLINNPEGNDKFHFSGEELSPQRTKLTEQKSLLQTVF